jgi:hypothetical protein
MQVDGADPIAFGAVMFERLRRTVRLALAVRVALAVLLAASAVFAAPGHGRHPAAMPVNAVVIDGIVFTICQSGRPASGDHAPVSAHTGDCVLCTLAAGLTPAGGMIAMPVTVFAGQQAPSAATYWPETAAPGLGARAPPAPSA